MVKVLIVSSYIYGKASANGLCAVNLRNAMNHADCEAYIVGYQCQDSFQYDEKEFTVNIDKCKPRLDKQNYARRMYALAKKCITPPINKAIVSRYLSKLIDLQETYHFDAIVGMYFPLETLNAAYLLKKKYTDLRLIVYELDSATDGIHSGGKLDWIYDISQSRWMKKIYNVADAVFVMRCHAAHVKTNYGKILQNRLNVVDLPLLQRTENSADCSIDKSTIDFFYTGILDSSYRNPSVLLDTFGQIESQSNWRLHFYSKGNCETFIRSFSDKDKRILQHGYVTSEELSRASKHADFFINIGNINSSSLPSKLIKYISCGKPIIHFSLQEDDICAEYLKHYSLALVIGKGTDIRDSAVKFEKFVRDTIHKRIPYEEIEQQYKENTPEYSVGRILRIIQ